MLRFRKIIALLLSVVLCLTMLLPVSAATASDALTDTADYVKKNTPKLGFGDEWKVMALARSGETVPAGYFSDYYKNLESYVKDCAGVLHAKKYSEYSRVIIALTAIGKDPSDVAGYDLLKPLSDYKQTIWQGMNGAIWALIALDSGDYASDLRQDYVDYLLSIEISGGGWTLAGEKADVDITAMTLQALSKYQDQPKVNAAVERGIAWLSKVQNKDGTFSTMGVATSESTAQVIVALGELGIAVDDTRFVKNGKSVMDGLLTYYTKGKGFIHIDGGKSDNMATEQGFYALVSADRFANGESSLYRMSSKATEVRVTFTDVTGHKNQDAIEILAGKGVINGMGNGTFAPNQTMTRAQFCTIVVKALGLTPKANNRFADVHSKAWYAGYVGTASDKGIVNGVGNSKFNPNGTITRQEAATMVARAAKQLGVDTTVEDADEILLLFSDGKQVASWAKDAIAFCYAEGVLAEESRIQPSKAILRCEIAQMLYNLLKNAGKI